MRILEADYSVSAVRSDQYPQDSHSEFALAGRSNVGKSSLINALTKRKNLARTSSTPGKTQTLNFYHINKTFYLVDVPGYGYAKVSKSQRQAFGQMIQDYLETRANLVGLLILIDARHAPTKDDIAMFDYATYLNVPILVVATKIDKVPKSKWINVKKEVERAFDLHHETVSFLTFSAQTGVHIEEVSKWLEQHLD